MIKNILFDLDGTLLPMDQDLFTKNYFSLLSKKLAPLGYEPKSLMNAIMLGINNMVQNNGDNTNEKVFWNTFTSIFGEKSILDKPIFEDFYKNEFQLVKQVCPKNKNAQLVIDTLKTNFNLILATNPIFPSIATESRIKWAGLNKNNFSLVTTYENSRHCKPNLDYYKYIISQLNLKPEECLMVGNDVQEDMIAKNLGMSVYLVTDCLINRDNTDISIFPNGNLNDLLKFINSFKQ